MGRAILRRFLWYNDNFLATLGTALLIYGAAIGPTWNIWQISINPPSDEYGLALAPMAEGGLWQIVTFVATGAFISWALREVEICRKLGMGYHVPVAFGVAVFAFVSLNIIRPVLMIKTGGESGWSHGFPKGFIRISNGSIMWATPMVTSIITPHI